MQTVDLYKLRMFDLRERIFFIQRLKAKTPVFDKFISETIALQFRLILESIALGSIVLHKDRYEEVHRDFVNHYNADKIFKKLEKINAYFYPAPQKPAQRLESGLVEVNGLNDKTALSIEEFKILYKTVNEIVHERYDNIKAKKVISFFNQVDFYLDKVKSLTSTHIIFLYEDAHFQLKGYLCQMKYSSKEDINVVFMYKRENLPSRPNS